MAVHMLSRFMHSRGRMTQRPDKFWLRNDHPYAQGLMFTILGNYQGRMTAFDSSAYDSPGTLTAMTPNWFWSSALNRFALTFDGTDDFVFVGNLPHLQITGPISVSAWVVVDTLPTDLFSYILVGKDAVNQRAYTLDIFHNNSSASSSGARFYINGGAATIPGKNIAAEGVALATGVLKHVCGTYDGSTVRIYVNGIPRTDSSSADASIGTSTSNVTIGKREYSGAEGYLKGSLSDVHIYNRVIPDGQIKDMSDPSNVSYGGMLYAERIWWPSVAIPTAAPVDNTSKLWLGTLF